jgi:protein-S-isoprenylcysteine O-methyltransferase Ste14
MTALLLKNALFTLVVPGTVAVYVPLWMVRDRSPASVPVVAVGAVVVALGGATYAWCVWDFAAFGRGTPAPIDAPKRLVVRGLYRHTRNPMYLGVLAVVLGWAMMFRAGTLVVYALCLGLAFHLFVVGYEERRLRREFGGEYERYCGQVGRWLPRMRPVNGPD